MENRKSYDVAVLGGGLTGFTAAVRCAQLGKKTALIEEHALGGAGRQLGTVPIHFLLQNAKIIRACTESKDKGLRFGKVSLNIEALHKAYETKLEKLATVLRDSLKSAGVEIYIGTGSPRTDGLIAITREGYKTRFIETDQLILAGGTVPDVPGKFRDVPGVLTDWTVGLTDYLPRTFIICGSGPKMCEAAQIYSIFGSQVTLLLTGTELLPGMGDMINESVRETLTAGGIKIFTNLMFGTVYRDSAYNFHLEAHARDSEEIQNYSAEDLYVTGDCRANLRGLDALPLVTNGGWIETDSHFKTSVNNVYAPSGSELIHGSQAGQAAAALTAAEAACGAEVTEYNSRLVPKVVETIPEAASIGLLPREAGAAGYDIKSGLFPMSLNDWAVMLDGDEGFVQVSADAHFGELLGVQAYGRSAAEIITIAESVMTLEGTVDDLANIVYPYPSVAEALGEAALDAVGSGMRKKS